MNSENSVSTYLPTRKEATAGNTFGDVHTKEQDRSRLGPLRRSFNIFTDALDWEASCKRLGCTR